MDEIEGIIKNAPAAFLKKRLESKIASYKEFNLQLLKPIINDLKLYQKVTMHPMSHGVSGMASFTLKEIGQSLDLLEKMEEAVDSLTEANVVSV